MNAITDQDIQAFVDDELDWEEAKPVRAMIFQNPRHEARYNQLMRQKKLLRLWYFFSTGDDGEGR